MNAEDRYPLPAPNPADAAAIQATLDAIRNARAIAQDARLAVDERLHYLRCIRLNLSAAEDRLAGLDTLPPCVAEKFGDIAASIHHAAANPKN